MSSTIKTIIRFNYSNEHSGIIFKEPLFYVGSNVNQNLLNVFGKPQDEKLVDKKFADFDVPTSMEMVSFDIDNELTINYLLDRFALEEPYEFTYDGVEFSIKANKELKQHIIKSSHQHEYTQYTSYTIRFDSDKIHIFEAFIKSSVEYYKKHYYNIKTEKNKIKLFISSPDGDYFERLGSRNPRMMDSIYLPQIDKDGIINDLTNFLDPKTEKWYNDMGIPYKRIYLLEGIPGGGKSSLIAALATLFGYNLAIVSFTPKTTDVSLLRAFRSLNDNHDNNNKHNDDEKKLFFVLEDMDCIFNKNRTSSEELHCSLTFSGVLNALDGITGDKKIGFISTNHIEQLNKALIRPGRIDYILKFDYATKEQIIMMYNKFTKNQDKELANEFYNGVCALNIKVSTSLLQQYLLKYHDSKPIEHLDELKKMYESSNVQKEADEMGLYN
jgi:hypothetical protein